MDRTGMQAETRSALSTADELSRVEHQEHAEDRSQILAALRTALRRIDLELGGQGSVSDELVSDLRHLTLKLGRTQSGATSGRVSALLSAAHDLAERLRPRKLQAPVDRSRLGKQLVAAGLGLALAALAGSMAMEAHRRS